MMVFEINGLEILYVMNSKCELKFKIILHIQSPIHSSVLFSRHESDFSGVNIEKTRYV